MSASGEGTQKAPSAEGTMEGAFFFFRFFRFRVSGFRISGLRFRVSGLRLRMLVPIFNVLWFRVLGLRV